MLCRRCRRYRGTGSRRATCAPPSERRGNHSTTPRVRSDRRSPHRRRRRYCTSDSRPGRMPSTSSRRTSPTSSSSSSSTGQFLFVLFDVPTKTSTFYLLNISARNQPIFTMFGAHIWWTFLTVSAILLVWNFSCCVVQQLAIWDTANFSGKRLSFTRYSGNVLSGVVETLKWLMWNFFRLPFTKNHSDHLIIVCVIHEIKGGRFYWETV